MRTASTHIHWIFKWLGMNFNEYGSMHTASPGTCIGLEMTGDLSHQIWNRHIQRRVYMILHSPQLALVNKKWVWWISLTRYYFVALCYSVFKTLIFHAALTICAGASGFGSRTMYLLYAQVLSLQLTLYAKRSGCKVSSIY